MSVLEGDLFTEKGKERFLQKTSECITAIIGFFEVFLEDWFSDLHVLPEMTWKPVWQQHISALPFCRPSVKEKVI